MLCEIVHVKSAEFAKATVIDLTVVMFRSHISSLLPRTLASTKKKEKGKLLV